MGRSCQKGQENGHDSRQQPRKNLKSSHLGYQCLFVIMQGNLESTEIKDGQLHTIVTTKYRKAITVEIGLRDDLLSVELPAD